MNIIKSQAFKDFSIIALILAITTAVFHLTNLDIEAEKLFFSTEKGWMLEYLPFWDFIYRFGIFPGYLFAIAGLVMISVSYWSVKYIKFRKAALILVFVMILGPGLIVNLLLKDHWGRPRPRDIKEFGGKETHVNVCIKGNSIEGKSFPCGHASMGFYMAIPYLFLRNRRKLLAYSFLAFGVVYGFVIGIARMMAGGHFLSDVFWAGGIVWIVGLIGYYLFKYEKPVEVPLATDEAAKKKARRVTIIVGIFLPVITVGLILATPYISKKTLTINHSELKKANSKTIRAQLNSATVEISNDTCFRANYVVNAFGFPNSKIRGTFTLGDTSTYVIENMGWFTEVKNNITMKLPMLEQNLYIINVEKGKIFCTLADSTKANFRFSINEGDIHLKINKNDLTIIGNKDKIENKANLKIQISATKAENSKNQIFEFVAKDGKLILE